MCRRPDSNWVSIPGGLKHYFGEMYTRASFFPPREVAFENQSFFIMNHPEEHLQKLYGDYMVVPPESDREFHGVLKLSFMEDSTDE